MMSGHRQVSFLPVMRTVLAFCAVLLLPAWGAGVEHAPKSVKIGVLAKRGPEICLEKWKPTAEYLSENIPDYTFSIVPLAYEEIDPAVERRDVDFVLANPAIYVGLSHDYGVDRIATMKNFFQETVFTKFGGVIFCKAARDDIRDLHDLKGKTFVSVNPRSLGGWLSIHLELKQQGIDPFSDFASVRFLGTHDAVVQAVRNGEADVGGVRTDTIERMALEGKLRLETFRAINEYLEDDYPFLKSTPAYPEWPFSSLRHVSRELAEQVAVALIGMPADNAAARAARCAGWTVPLNYQEVRDCLKALSVHPFDDYGKITWRIVLQLYWPWMLGGFLVAVFSILVAIHVTRLNRKLSTSIQAEKKELAGCRL